jgi:type IV secretory pathway VirB4 component
MNIRIAQEWIFTWGGDVGHTLVLGATANGKSFLNDFLIAQREVIVP